MCNSLAILEGVLPGVRCHVGVKFSFHRREVLVLVVCVCGVGSHRSRPRLLTVERRQLLFIILNLLLALHPSVDGRRANLIHPWRDAVALALVVLVHV